MKNVYFVFIILLIGCSNQNTKIETDLTTLGLKGNVKSMKEINFMAEYRFGETELGKKGAVIDYWKFNKLGYIEEHHSLDSSEILQFLTKYKYDNLANKKEIATYGNDGYLVERQTYVYENNNLIQEQRFDDKNELINTTNFKYKNDVLIYSELTYSSTGDKEITKYYIDKAGNIIKKIIDNQLIHNYKFDGKNEIMSLTTNNRNDTLSYYEYRYDKFDRKIIEKVSDHVWKNYYSDSLVYQGDNPIESYYKDFSISNSKLIKTEYSYEIDKKDNWTKKTILNNSIPKMVIIREIEYY